MGCPGRHTALTGGSPPQNSLSRKLDSEPVLAQLIATRSRLTYCSAKSEPVIPFTVAYPQLRGGQPPGGEQREQGTPDENRRANREGRSMATSSKVAGGLGSGGMANTCKSPINVVSTNRPKLLTGLNQKGGQPVNPL